MALSGFLGVIIAFEDEERFHRGHLPVVFHRVVDEAVVDEVVHDDEALGASLAALIDSYEDEGRFVLCNVVGEFAHEAKFIGERIGGGAIREGAIGVRFDVFIKHAQLE